VDFLDGVVDIDQRHVVDASHDRAMPAVFTSQR
jgi:hypothetical protein